MQLIKDEKVVKEFEYATVKRGNDHISCSVTVTNKRVYTTDVSNKGIAHTELPIEKVKCINSHLEIPNNILAIIAIIYAAMFFVLAIGLMVGKVMPVELRFIVLFVAVEVSFILTAILLWQHPSFTLNFTTYGREGKSLYTSVAKLAPSKGRPGRIKVHLKKEVCQEFMETIGAALVEARMLAKNEIFEEVQDIEIHQEVKEEIHEEPQEIEVYEEVN